MSRLFEASSWAGFAGIITALAQIVASQGTDPMAWGTFIAGVIAVVIPEKK
jgi:hypothetical protein